MIPTMSGRRALEVAPRPAFEEEAVAVVSRLREEMAALFAALPGPLSGGTDLRRQLGLSSTLSWQLHSFVTAPNPVAAIGHVPGSASIAKLVQAARRKGVESSILERVGDAFGRFERVAAEHAGDRATFDSMLAALGDPQADVIDAKLRKAHFNNNAVLWGLRQKVSFGCYVTHPGRRADSVHFANIVGSIGLLRLRESAKLKLTVSSHAQMHDSDDAEPRVQGTVSPLRLLSEFCSGPLPDLSAHPYKPGGVMTELHLSGLGRAAALNLAMVQLISNASQSEDETLFSAGRITTPSELQCMDVLVPAGWSDPESVAARVYANRGNSEDVWRFHPDDLLPMRVAPAYQGRVRMRGSGGAGERPAPVLIDVPRYAEMIGTALTDLGWEETEFDLYRCRIEYPVLGAVLHLSTRKAKAPSKKA